jgi:mono/diheme cytochrome c family protein
MQKEAPAPRDLSTMTTADLLAGAENYKKDCAVCHGLPDQPTAAIGSGMFPPAPQLMAPPPPGGGPGQMQTGPPPPGPERAGGPGRGESNDFWRIKNGIRLTGMPSFEKALSDDQIWQLAALLANRGNMPPEVKAALESDAALSEARAAIAPAANKGTTKGR